MSGFAGALFSKFTAAGSTISVDYLVVGSGGAGGGWQGGGGGAGGLLTGTALSLSLSTAYTVSVGANGIATTYTGAGDTRGTAGSNSVFSTLTAIGGGYGGAYGGGTAAWAVPGNGGSGGGGGFVSPAIAGGTGTAGPPIQGYAGGAGNAIAFNEGGGGGAGQIGGLPTSQTGGYAGVGGDGILVTGFATPFAGTGNITSGSATLTTTAVSAGGIKIGTQITGTGIRTAQSIAISTFTPYNNNNAAAANFAYITFATQASAPFSVGQVITIAGTTAPTSYNAPWIVTTCNTTSATIACSFFVTAGSFSIGTTYTIVTPGTTSFTAIGAANNTAGTIFTATGAGSGTGTAAPKPIVTGATISAPAAYIAGQLTATNAATVTATFTQATAGSRTIVLSSYTVGSAAAIAIGQFVQPISGIIAGTYVIGISGNTITISNPTTGAIAASASLYTAGQTGTYTLSAQATATTTGVALTSSGDYFAGGGGGGPDAAANTYGGAGGGGKGNKNALASSGAANTGGGGGGAYGATAGSGGTGVVIIKIPAANTATFSGGVTSTLDSSVSGFKIYTVKATSTTSETVTFT